MRFGKSTTTAIALAAVSLSSIAGCWRSSVPPAPPVVATPPVEPAASPPADAPGEKPAEVVPSEPPPVEPAAPQPPPIPAERMLLLAPRGPLVVEFEIWIDGQPQSKVFDQLLEEVLQLADTDGDGLPMWSEVTASPRFKYGQFGNLPIDRDNAPKQITQQYDLNRNGQVDRSELPRFLTRNAGGGQAFSVRSIEQYHNRNRDDGPAWRVIDADDNGELSADEIEAAAAQLKLHDSDDDEIVLVDELRPSSDIELTGTMANRGQRGDFARVLGEHAIWDSIRTALEGQYASGGDLDLEDFRLMGEVFEQLDADRDGRLTRKEFLKLNEVAAHLRFKIEFGKTDEPAVIALVSSRLTNEQLGGELQTIEHPGRVVVRWPGVSLTFLRNDTIAAADYEAQAKQALMQYDTSADGYLEESEVSEMVQTQFARFAALDTDGDGKVYSGEIEAFLRQRQSAQRAQVHTRTQDRPDSLFLALDRNADDRLDARELDAAAEQLKKLDANTDGVVSTDELPTGLATVIARGSVEAANQLFAVGPVDVRQPAANLPRWFSAMDTSGDGVISGREFLGSAEKFAELDANRNGFFEPAEIPAEPQTAATEPANEKSGAAEPGGEGDAP